jgi:16S rRNA (cytidine1402-2'-O)-methyltransferase
VTAGTLYLVATPIGNLEDVTLRALRVLREADVIAAEDTRRTSQLLRHFGIATRTVSYHAHNERARMNPLLERLRTGASVALVSDAGTPGISDPGQTIVAACVCEGIRVVPVPGASAAIAALAASGLSTERFVFLGFPPRRPGDRRRLLESARREAATLILFEAPTRAHATLQALHAALGDREAVVAREVTKVHEEFVRGTLAALATRYASEPPRGEVTIVVAGDPAPDRGDARPAGEDLDGVLRESLRAGRTVRESAAGAAARCGVPRRVAYERALRLRAETEHPDGS